MPEGDTLHRAARHLRRALVGHPLTEAQAGSIDVSSLIGRTPGAVEAHGKNLLIRVQNQVLHTHLRMTGSWHIYRPGEPWQKPARQAVLQLGNAVRIAVCFDAPVVRLLSAARAARDRQLSGLGPDLLAPEPDYDEMRRRLLLSPERPLGEALLDQRLVAGIGNVYKSELCFRLALDPFLPVGHIGAERLLGALQLGRRMMKENLQTFRRTTRIHPIGSDRYWVYGRAGKPCSRCGGVVAMRRQGDAGRSTYFCSSCQVRSRLLAPPR